MIFGIFIFIHLLLVFAQVLRPFLLRRKKDEVEKYLPSKTQVILKCDFSAWQKAYYEQVASKGKVALGDGTFYFQFFLPSRKYFWLNKFVMFD